MPGLQADGAASCCTLSIAPCTHHAHHAVHPTRGTPMLRIAPCTHHAVHPHASKRRAPITHIMQCTHMQCAHMPASAVHPSRSAPMYCVLRRAPIMQCTHMPASAVHPSRTSCSAPILTQCTHHAVHPHASKHCPGRLASCVSCAAIRCFGRRFVYEEEQGAESFFVPYVWGLVLHATSGLRWDTRNAELLQG